MRSSSRRSISVLTDNAAPIRMLQFWATQGDEKTCLDVGLLVAAR
jgi:hypothetical protein